MKKGVGTCSRQKSSESPMMGGAWCFEELKEIPEVLRTGWGWFVEGEAKTAGRAL